MKTKDEVLTHLKGLNSMFKNQYGQGIKIIRTDNGGEYIISKFKEYTDNEGIVHQKTTPYTPSQNGIAERLNRTIIQIVRALQTESGLSDQLWPEIVLHANYLRNVNITSTLETSPYEAYHSQQPNLNNLLVFGSVVIIVKQPHERNGKLDTTGKRGIFIGYVDGVKGFKVWLPDENKIVLSMKIKATEKVLYKDVNWNPATNYISKFDLESLVEKAIAINNEPSQKPSETPVNIDFLPDTENHQDTRSETQSMDGLHEYKPSATGTEFVPIVRPRISAVQRQEEAKKNREAKEARLMHEALVEYGELGITYECMSLELPSSYMEAADDPKWEEAMAKEMESFRKHGVFSPVKFVNGMKLVGGNGCML
ncbi:hypothetical protein SeLEV6574_g01027 [Synchytrium endobioticum]|uniref:Integrase catalytic domain-containing protein n=1 Tax=Synchytrium endobioticum TaxID=286115 RepID=A0A507DEQ1_9FUNG|nr:hypothetical protein SeLEV6574_g01027 [Synchytrium endobioticum]